VTPGRAGWLLVSVVGSYVVGDGLFLVSTQILGVPVALAIASTYPLWSAFAGWAFLGQGVNPAGLAGVILVVAGVVTVVRGRSGRADEPHAGAPPTHGPGRTTGVLLASATSLFWALNTFAVAKGGEGIPFASVNTVRMGLAAMLLLLLRLVVPRRATPLLLPARELRRAWPVLLLEGVGGTALFVIGLTRSPLAVAAALTSLAPVLSVPLALAIRRERVDGRTLLGIVVVTVGVIVLVGSRRG